jgi:hypothetical protein
MLACHYMVPLQIKKLMVHPESISAVSSVVTLGKGGVQSKDSVK